MPLSIVAVVALACGGALFWSMQRQPGAEPARAPSADAPVPIDAAIDAPEVVDAMEPDAAEQMVAPPAIDAGTVEKPAKKKRGKKRGKPPRSDLGSSRF
jgi:hypothetical protein